MSVIVNQTFSGSANPISGIWGTLYSYNAVEIVSGLAQATVTSSACICYDNVNSYNNNQTGSITIGGTPANGGVWAIILRVSNPANASYQYVQWVIVQGSTNAGWFQIVPSTGHAYIPTLNTPPVANDVYTFTVTNQTYSFYQNGALLSTYTDLNSYATSGTTGFAFYAPSVLTEWKLSRCICYLW